MQEWLINGWRELVGGSGVYTDCEVIHFHRGAKFESISKSVVWFYLNELMRGPEQNMSANN